MQAIYAPSPSLHLQRWRWLYWTVTWVSSLAAAAFKWNILPSLLQLAILNCDTLLHSNVISCQACTSPSFCIAPLFQEQIGAHHQSCESSRFRSISFKYLPKAWFTNYLCSDIVSTPGPRNPWWMVPHWCSTEMWSRIMHPAASLSSALWFCTRHCKEYTEQLHTILQRKFGALHCREQLHTILHIENFAHSTAVKILHVNAGLNGNA